MSSREEAKGETGQGKKEKRKEKKKKERNGREEKKEEDAAAAAVAAAAESPRSRSARPSLSAAPAAGSPRGRPAPPAGPASCPPQAPPDLAARWVAGAGLARAKPQRPGGEHCHPASCRSQPAARRGQRG